MYCPSIKLLNLKDIMKKNFFLSDPSPIIGYPCHSLIDDLIEVTLACEDANSKLFEAVTVADVDGEDRIGNSLLQIWKLRFGHKGLSTRFGQDFEDEVQAKFEDGVWSVFCC